MNFIRVLISALALTAFCDMVALANTMPAQQSEQDPISQQYDSLTKSGLAVEMPHSANAMVAPQKAQQPRKLPLANFGQWDEAASEN